MARDFDFYVNRALEAFENGFTTKSAQQEAISDLNYAARELRTKVTDVCFAIRDAQAKEQGLEWVEMDERCSEAYWLNYDLHVWNAKRRNTLLACFDGEDKAKVELVADQFDDLAALRLQIKNAEIVKVVKEESPLVAKIHMSIMAEMEKRKEQFAHGIKLVEIFGRLPVSMNVHLVTNQFGTTFPRTFFYMNGKLTQLNMIIAILQATAKEEDK